MNHADYAQALASIDRKLCKIETLLTGNGDPGKGIIVRLDRVEQKLGFRSKVTWVLFGGVFGSGAITSLILYFLA